MPRRLPTTAGEQDPAAELADAAMTIAAQVESVDADRQRTGSRSDGARFAVESFARHFIHNPVHHFYDVTGARYASPAEPGTWS